METGDYAQTRANFFIRNPVSCTAPICLEKLDNSPFLSATGVMGEILLYRIKRPPPTASSRSPWSISNFCQRPISSVKNFFGVLLLEEARLVRHFDSRHIAGAFATESLEECKRKLLLEYLSIDLAEILAMRYKDNLGPLEAPKAIKASFDILSALDYLHTDMLMLHGDLKSFNVLVYGDFENVKICGLGSISKSLNPDGTLDHDSNPDNEKLCVGLWSAPEAFENTNENITSKVDIFSFGLVVYEMLACMPPHTFPGILDHMIADSDGMIEAHNAEDTETDMSDSVKDGDDDQDDLEDNFDRRHKHMRVIAPLFVKRNKCVARKRQSKKDETGTVKKIKYDEVIIDLVDEEEPTKEAAATPDDGGTIGNANDVKDQELALSKTASANVVSDTTGSQQEVNGKEKIVPEGITETEHPTSAKPITAEEKAELPVTVESSAENLQAEQEDGKGEVKDTPTACSNSSTNEASENFPSKVEKATTSTKGSNIAFQKNAENPVALATKRQEDSSDVVMVIDSSDEENDVPVKPYEVNSSDSSIHSCSSDDEGALNNTGESQKSSQNSSKSSDGPKEEIIACWNFDGNYLNYECVGTRPPIPAEITFGKEYNILLEMFVICTNQEIELRPSAAQLLKAYRLVNPESPSAPAQP
ncbi:uncharacterized protein LOC126563928 [Anopheles maculipalpis]|uniref:uncharacterized protein LOC126563928 n=1 Tax=Anopheles maculipalpis TaxID=1496333 RepID=UPI002158EE1F|nr:uncharacterized protein LOC126563928 [Anopheles maculipalpis]